MNFSDQWRSLFSIPSIFPSPSLLLSTSSSYAAATAAAGPLHFLPSNKPLLLSHLPSLQIPPPLPPPSHLPSLRSFLSSSFLPSSSVSSLLSDLLPYPSALSAASNLLCSLPSRSSPSTSLLFFPTGDNSHSIASLRLPLPLPPPNQFHTPKIGIQNDGFKHPCHRILKLSAVPASDHDVSLELTGKSSCIIEGFLIASTLYSVNWFRVETRVSGREEGVSVVPMAKQGFESAVVDAQMCTYCPEQSVVLLESGELCWFDMESKRSGKVGVFEGLGGCWLGCEFGGQPWIVIVACSSAVVAVDLRAKKVTEAKVLVRIDEGKDDRILAFCKSGFDDFRISVVMERQLLVYDVRQPLVPVLMWDHGLQSPCYVTMFRLSYLRPSEEFKWASDSGSVILVGSFWKDEFSIFFCGPREGGTFDGDSMLYAWELPFSFSLSGRHCGLGDSLVKDDFSADAEWRQKKDVVAGFWIVPNDLLNVESEYGGFCLIRLMSSGKLEMQTYHASWDSVSEKPNREEEESLKLNDSLECSTEQKGKTSSRYYPLNIEHLWEYMNGFLSRVMLMRKPQLSEFNQKFSSDILGLLKGIKLEPSTSAINIINDATVPTNIFEITLQRVLNNLEFDLLPLAFSKYLLLFGNDREATFSLLEVPKCLPHHRSIPFFVGNPLRISVKYLRKVSQALVGPVFPVPFLLLLQRMDHQEISACLKEEVNDDLLTPECRTTLENVYPEISLADAGNFSECESFHGLQNENSFFVYEKSVVGNISACEGSWRISQCAVKGELPQTDDTCLDPEPASEDEKLTTFICGISNKAYYLNSGNEASGLEMFDRLSPYRLDFDSPSMVFQPKEQEMYKRLTRQSCKWLGNYKPHEDFCVSSNIPKPPH